MWWNREKRVTVELVNPVQIQCPAQQPAQPAAPALPPATEPQRLSLDGLLKLEAMIIVVMQAMLGVFGYCVLAGQYDAFGIQLSELEVGSLDFLFQGYLSFFMKVVQPAVPDLGMLVLVLMIAGPAIPPAIYLRRFGKWVDTFLAALLLCGVIIFTWLMPLYGIQVGLDDSKSQLAAAGLTGDLTHIDRHHTVQTDAGEKAGTLIAVSSRHTFLLVGTEVLKISNDSNKVVRVTRFQSREASQ